MLLISVYYSYFFQIIAVCSLSFVCIGHRKSSSPWLWTIAVRVLPVTENAFVWLTIAAASDLLLDVVHFTNMLTYLLLQISLATFSEWSILNCAQIQERYW